MPTSDRGWLTPERKSVFWREHHSYQGMRIHKIKLKILKTDWLPKQIDGKDHTAFGQLANEKLRLALFSEDAVKNKRNTDAVEVAPSTLVSARVIEFVPFSVKPFESVKVDIEKKLKAQEASDMARKSGEARLAELQKSGEDTLAWSSVRNISRMQGRTTPSAALKAIFKADAEKLPAYVAASVDDGFALYKVVKATRPEKIDSAALKEIQSELTRIVAREDLSAYFTVLRSRYKVDINASMLQVKDR